MQQFKIDSSSSSYRMRTTHLHSLTRTHAGIDSCVPWRENVKRIVILIEMVSTHARIIKVEWVTVRIVMALRRRSADPTSRDATVALHKQFASPFQFHQKLSQATTVGRRCANTLPVDGWYCGGGVPGGTSSGGCGTVLWPPQDPHLCHLSLSHEIWDLAARGKPKALRVNGEEQRERETEELSLGLYKDGERGGVTGAGGQVQRRHSRTWETFCIDRIFLFLLYITTLCHAR